VLALVTTGAVHLQYRVADDPNAGKSSIDVDATFRGQMAVLTGRTVTAVQCRVPKQSADPDDPAADYVCTARLTGAEPRTFGVRVVGSGLQFLFEVK
jgi:hypothetical protein